MLMLQCLTIFSSKSFICLYQKVIHLIIAFIEGKWRYILMIKKFNVQFLCLRQIRDFWFSLPTKQNLLLHPDKVKGLVLKEDVDLVQKSQTEDAVPSEKLKEEILVVDLNDKNKKDEL